ncbi:MAG TPA: hypothetical protein VEJ19_01140 [Nitrososphaerales archaeon]|nr:hypothetical protein [Nitrososphaerales archaeon]
MSALEELVSYLTGPSRAIVIARKDVDLRPESGDNTLFVLNIGEGSLAAGGRGGGFGERKVSAVSCFELKSNTWSLVFRASPEKAMEYEVPYYVSRLPLTMPDGAETMGYGVIDPELVSELSRKSGIVSSA